MSDIMRKVLAGVVTDFVIGKSVRSERFFENQDLDGDDPVKLPEGKVVKVTFEYVDEKEIEK